MRPLAPVSASSPSVPLDPLVALMTRNPVIVDRKATLDQALDLLERYGFRHLPVVECDRLLGMVSDRDLRLATGLLPAEQRLGAPRGRRLPGAERVEQIMREPAFWLPPEASASRAAREMVERRIGAIPVLQDGLLCGIVTETDLLRTFLERSRSGQGHRDDLVRYHMHEPLTCIGPDTPIEEAFDALDLRVGHMGVSVEGELIGIVAERDLRLGLARSTIRDLRAQAEGRMEDTAILVAEVMTERVVCTRPGEQLSTCAARLLDNRVSALPVLDEQRPVGILTQRHILEYFARDTRP